MVDINTEISKVTFDNVEIPIRKDNLENELNEQEALLEDLKNQVNELPEKDVDLSETTATAEDVKEGKEFFNATGEKTIGTYVDRLQRKCDTMKTLRCEFANYSGSDYSLLEGLDTSKVENWNETFYLNNRMQNIPQLDFSGATGMNSTFQGCTSLKSATINPSNTTKEVKLQSTFLRCTMLENINILDAPNVTDYYYFVSECKALENITLPPSPTTVFAHAFSYCSNLKTININNMSANSGNGRIDNMCTNCTALTSIKTLNLAGIKTYTNAFYNCKALTELDVRNIWFESLQIGSGTSWGHLLTLDSLLNTIKELWINTETKTKTLTVGTANLEKLANVYVKLIDITDEMRAEDEYIDKKAPFVQCESTDDGAMLITEYVTTVKKWQLA